MRKLLLLSLVAVSALAMESTKADVKEQNITKEANSSRVFDYKLEPKKITDGIWCFLGALEPPTKKNGGNMVNTCYIKSKSSFIVIDSGPSYQYAKQAYEKMSKISNLPVRAVIDTHDHDDHWLGNSFYKEKFGATIIGPKLINTNYKESDKTRMFRILPENAILGSKIIPVDIVPLDPIHIEIDQEELEINPIGYKAHTPEDIFVYLPKRRVIFAGDLAMNGRITSNRDGSLLGELKAIKTLREKKWDYFIPGHGFDTSKHGLDEAEKYFKLLYERVSKAIDDEVEAEEITSVVKMEEFKDKAMYKELNARNVADAYTEIEFAQEE